MQLPIKQILFATDFSEPSIQAQRYACSLADNLGALLHVVHVVTDPMPLPSVTGMAIRPIEDQLPKIIQSTEQKLAAELSEAKKANPRIVTDVLVGDPALQINDYANTHSIDLTIVGTHGRRGLAHALIGSVAEKLVRISKCPVMTVHPQEYQYLMDSSNQT